MLGVFVLDHMLIVGICAFFFDVRAVGKVVQCLQTLCIDKVAVV